MTVSYNDSTINIVLGVIIIIIVIIKVVLRWLSCLTAFSAFFSNVCLPKITNIQKAAVMLQYLKKTYLLTQFSIKSGFSGTL